MNHLYFPMNLGGGNRGCEAIIRGTVKILNLPSKNVSLLDMDDEEYTIDHELKVNGLGELYVQDSISSKHKCVIFIHKVLRKLKLEKKWFHLLPYKTMLSQCNKQTPVFFTGGDLYCYASTVQTNTYLHEVLYSEHIPTVLWGASVASDYLTDDVVRQLKNFTCITCRESYSVENLKNAGIIQNVSLYPDPAFVLEPVETQLPSCFETAEVVGINISNFVNPDYSLDTVFGTNIVNLVQHILNTSSMNILLIPHVTWKGQDDRIICRNLYEKFADTRRVHLLKIDNVSYCEIRYMISKCRYFIGARTHSVISAYSMCVPTITLGYSVKSRGIAHDIALDEQLVVNCKKLNSDNELVVAYEYLLKHEKQIKQHLCDVMPGYINKAYEAKYAVAAIINE